MGNVAKYQHGWNMTFTVVELLMIIPKSTYLSISLPYFSIYHFFSLTLYKKPTIMKKQALITGATSGIGHATALRLAALGYDIIATGRRAERLAALKSAIEAQGGSCRTLCFDVRSEAECRKHLEPLDRVDLLLNNAGLAAGLEHIDQGSTADWDAMIDTNVKGLLYVTRIITPKMIAAGGGHVINIGSIAGTEPYENGAVYCASKHAVHAISQAMRADLLSHRIKVTEIRPGMVETEFSLVRFHGDQERADKTYTGVEPLTGADIAETIAWIVQLPAHMNVNDIVLMPAQQAGAYYTCRNTK